MATPVTKYADTAGNLFDTVAEAEVSDSALAAQARINALVEEHFPLKEGKKYNPHASTACRAINLWIAHTGQPFQMTA